MDSVLLDAAHRQCLWSEWNPQPSRSLCSSEFCRQWAKDLAILFNKKRATVQSIEQHNLSGICYMLDLTPTCSSRWVSQVAEEWAVSSVLFTISLVQKYLYCVPSVVEDFRVRVSCYNTMPQGCLFTSLLNITACASREREREMRRKTSSPTGFSIPQTQCLWREETVFFRPLFSGRSIQVVFISPFQGAVCVRGLICFLNG